ncbi:Stress-response A/B barrel domain-containing protein hs1 [Dionaea muscipula]
MILCSSLIFWRYGTSNGSLIFCLMTRRGTNVSIENLHQGFTHVFESTFETVEGVAEYIVHRAHVEFADRFLACLEKVLIVDFKPSKVVL